MREHLAEHVGAGAGGILPVARAHVAGAHGAAHEVRFAALLANAGTSFGGTKHALGRAEGEDGPVIPNTLLIGIEAAAARA